MTIKDRILSYLKEQGISREDFYRATGLSASNFKGAALNSELGGEKVVKILSTYRDVSPDWLLLDEGSMLRNDQAQSTPPPVVQADSSGEAAIYYKMYKEEKAEKESKVEELNAKMLQMAEELGSLKNQLSQSQPKPTKQKGRPAVLGSTETVPPASIK